MFGIRFIKARPTTYLMQYRRGQVAREGVGLSFYYFAPTTIFAIERTGAKPIAEGYRCIVDELRPDIIILVDGGTDSLMRGDEADLGTPQEDIASLAAVHDLNTEARKYLVLLGFGIDAFHGVCHAHFLENVAALMGDGYLGAWAVLPEMEEFRLYDLDRIRDTSTYGDLCLAIDHFRCSIQKTRCWSEIPC